MRSYSQRVLLRVLLLIACAISAFADDPFKADILVVVAHPDDGTVIGSYLARAALDQHKRVAVVFGTRGGSGGNAVAQAQSGALEDIRQIEAVRAMGHFGITNVWFLRGADTAGQDVLRSLENWNHGDALARLVRIVRLTRPAVILSWLPAVLMGEDHGDHQAAGVLATEAFDSAGNPSVFGEQLGIPRNARDTNNLSEGLQIWQPEKLYYFSDTNHPETLAGRGPVYSPTDTSPSRHVSYARLAAESGAEHRTQLDSGLFAYEALRKNARLGYFEDKVRFVFAKSYVSSDVSADILSGITEEPLPFRSPPQRIPDLTDPVSLAGPWLFYRYFWAAHGTDLLETIAQHPELLVNFENPVTIPVVIRNGSRSPIDANISVRVPPGWVFWRRAPEHIHLLAHAVEQFTFQVRSPKEKTAPGEITVKASGVGEVRLHVEVSLAAMPQ